MFCFERVLGVTETLFKHRHEWRTQSKREREKVYSVVFGVEIRMSEIETVQLSQKHASPRVNKYLNKAT